MDNNKIITASTLLLITTTFTVGSPTYKAFTPYHSTPVYKEEKLIYQPFTQEYEHNNKKTKIENQIQEHEQKILEITQETDKRQIYVIYPKFIYPGLGKKKILM